MFSAFDSTIQLWRINKFNLQISSLLLEFDQSDIIHSVLEQASWNVKCRLWTNQRPISAQIEPVYVQNALFEWQKNSIDHISLEWMLQHMATDLSPSTGVNICVVYDLICGDRKLASENDWALAQENVRSFGVFSFVDGRRLFDEWMRDSIVFR